MKNNPEIITVPEDDWEDIKKNPDRLKTYEGKWIRIYFKYDPTESREGMPNSPCSRPFCIKNGQEIYQNELNQQLSSSQPQTESNVSKNAPIQAGQSKQKPNTTFFNFNSHFYSKATFFSSSIVGLAALTVFALAFSAILASPIIGWTALPWLIAAVAIFSYNIKREQTEQNFPIMLHP